MKPENGLAAPSPERQLKLETLSITRVAALLERFPRVVDRLFTAGEAEYCRSQRRRPAQHFAVRLAAKFAVRRLLEGGRLRNIEVLRDPSGYPKISLSGVAADRAGGRQILVSLSHDADVAAAVVAPQASE